jgi:hypothetical protein
VVSRQREYQLLYPDRHAAREAVHAAVKAGKMPHPTLLSCAECGKPAVGYHHHKGYAFAYRLEVQALCAACHGRAHRLPIEQKRVALVFDWVDVPAAKRMTPALYRRYFRHYGARGVAELIAKVEMPRGCEAATTVWIKLGVFYAPCHNRARVGHRYCGLHLRYRVDRWQAESKHKPGPAKGAKRQERHAHGGSDGG